MENAYSNDYIELQKFLSDFCKEIKDIKRDNTDIETIKRLVNSLHIFQISIISLIDVINTGFFIHCDLHSKNIFINTKNGRIKLIDFGLSKFSNTKENLRCDTKRSSTKILYGTSNECFGKGILYQMYKFNPLKSDKFDQTNLVGDEAMIYEYIQIYNRINTKIEKIIIMSNIIDKDTKKKLLKERLTNTDRPLPPNVSVRLIKQDF